MIFSPDGRSLASSDQDGAVRLWETATGGERDRFAGHRCPVRVAAFSADGKILATASYDTTVLLWDLTGRSEAGAVPAAFLSPQALEDCWSDLAASDAARAYRAERKLTSIPDQAVTHLKTRLKPVAVGDKARFARLIAELDSDEFAVRRKATNELQRLGESAESALRQALQGKPTLEARRRIETLLERVKTLADSPEGLRKLRALEVLEHIGTTEARRLLAKLAGGAAEARWTREAKTSLERLRNQHK